MLVKRWNLNELDTTLASEIAEACELSPFLSLLLTTKGIDSPEQAYDYLVGQQEEFDPYELPDMEKAVERIQEALDRQQRILVYGDYDVDGITATVLLYTYLKERGADVIYRVPTREEGYGLHPATVEWAAGAGVELIVTVDTGISALEECRLAMEHGIDVVITDHHQPGEEIPNACAVVDPHRKDADCTFTDFAGVGVAFMLACALEGDGESIFRTYGDLLTLGTLADVMPLVGFNRDLIRRGMLFLNESTRPGLLALRRVAGCENKDITSTSAAFTLVPRLNAAGRMENPDISVRLLLSASSVEADPLAEKLQMLNTRRQEEGDVILRAADALIKENPSWLYDRVLVLAGEGWHHGLLGIVAARMVERFGKPALVLGIGEDGLAHGSGRSISGFSLFDALQHCEPTLSAFGGHELAAGVTLRKEQIDAFRTEINTYAKECCREMPVPSIDVAVRLRPDQINTEKLLLMDVMEPFGAGNAAPLFGLFRMKLDNITALGGGKHLRLSLSRGGVRISAMKFQTMPEEFPIPCGSLVNCVVSLDKNEYRGNLSVSICVKDISFTDTDREQLIADISTFNSIMRRECCPPQALPERRLLTVLYSLIHACKDWNGTLEQLIYAVSHNEGSAPSALTVLAAVEILYQAGLISKEDKGERLALSVLPVEQKADLSQTPLWKYLEGGMAHA